MIHIFIENEKKKQTKVNNREKNNIKARNITLEELC